MAGLRDRFRYREEAERFLGLADAHIDEPQLRDGYLALAIQFERLADILEKGAAGVDQQPRAMARGEQGPPETDDGTAPTECANALSPIAGS